MAAGDSVFGNIYQNFNGVGFVGGNKNLLLREGEPGSQTPAGGIFRDVSFKWGDGALSVLDNEIFGADVDN